MTFVDFLDKHFGFLYAAMIWLGTLTIVVANSWATREKPPKKKPGNPNLN